MTEDTQTSPVEELGQELTDARAEAQVLNYEMTAKIHRLSLEMQRIGSQREHWPDDEVGAAEMRKTLEAIRMCNGFVQDHIINLQRVIAAVTK